MTNERPPPKPRRLRALREEEIELWLGVAESVTRRAGATLPERFAVPEPVVEAPLAIRQQAPAPIPPPAKAALPMAPLERKLKQRLSRGKMAADAAIDLHGFRQAEAFSALRHFLMRAQRDGARVVLVVTGKGGRQMDRFDRDRFDLAGRDIGVLKRAVPIWLSLPEFRALVIGYEEAGRPHGGAGALYVRLRRG